MKNGISLGTAVATLLMALGADVSGQAVVGTARNFGVLAASTITNVGATVVTGDLGVSPGGALTGFPPGTVVGAVHLADAVALQAQSDALTAFGVLAGSPCDSDLSGQDLGGLTLTPGVYCFTSSAQLTGPLVLNAMNDPAAVFIFRIGSTLTTASASSVAVINGGSACNVLWIVGTSATLGGFCSFVGTILASASVTLNGGAAVTGKVVALNGAVTMISNSVTVPAECLCTDPASVVDLGPGCGAPAPTLTSSLLVVGQSATLNLTGGSPNAMMYYFVSACGGAPLTVPGTSCVVYLDLSTLQTFTMGTTDGSGAFSLTFDIPADAALLGQCFVVQGLVWSTNGPLGGDYLTNGLRVIIGCS